MSGLLKIPSLVLVTATMTLSVSMQGPDPSVTILEPEGTSYVAGLVRLKAGLDPMETPVKSVEFYVDGRLVCQTARFPFECTWDAGSTGAARIIADCPLDR